MAKTYWIARIDVHDIEPYKKYVEIAKPAFERFGARFLARGGKVTNLEGTPRGRNVVIEFASLEDALACYNSPEYTEARKYRQQASDSEFLLVEGAE